MNFIYSAQFFAKLRLMFAMPEISNSYRVQCISAYSILH